MTAEVDAFLDPIIVDLCRFLQLKDPNTDEYLEEEPVVRLCVLEAYTQVRNFLHRSFVRDTFVEYHKKALDRRLVLKNYPVSEILLVENVSPIDYTERETLAETDYALLGRTLCIKTTATIPYFDRYSYSFLIGGTLFTSSNSDISEAPIFRVTYKAGAVSADDVPDIKSGIFTQAQVNWNRKDSLGMWTVSGAGSGGEVKGPYDPNDNDLVKMVREMLSPYCYFGTAESEDALF